LFSKLFQLIDLIIFIFMHHLLCWLAGDSGPFPVWTECYTGACPPHSCCSNC